MNTVEYLEQIERIERATQNKLIEIAQCEAMAMSITATVKEVNVQSSGDKDRLGCSVVKIIELEEQYNKQVDELIAKKQKIISQIEKVENTDEYHVLFSRYVAMKSLTEIGKEMFYSYRTIDKIHKNAIDSFTKVLINENSQKMQKIS